MEQMASNSDFRARLASHDAYWAWKLSLRVLLILIDITTIGLVAWEIPSAISQSNEDLDISDMDLIPWALVPLGTSLIWCTIVVLIQTLRKIPVHPGVAVGLDLLLWLVFAPISSFTIIDASEVINGNGDDFFNDGLGSDSGYYTTAANGSTIFVTPSNNDCPRFSSCADQTSFNKEARHRGVVEMASGALMIIALVLHFTLFIWACVDTAARNSSRTQKQAKEIANAMIAEMVASGQIPPPQRPLLVPSERGSQAMSETIGRETNAYYMTPAGGYYAPQSFVKGPARPQSQPQQQVQFAPPAHLISVPHDQQQIHPAFRTQVVTPQAVPSPQQAKSEGDTPPNGNGDGSGFHTPPSHPSEPSTDYHALSTDHPDDQDAIRPLPPLRAPGHVYSPRGSVVSYANSNSPT